MRHVLVIGIGAGDPDHMTMQAIKALNQADVVFVPDKGAAKDRLAEVRREICARFITGTAYRVVSAAIPERDRGGDYRGGVDALNRAKAALFGALIERELPDGDCGAFLVWGDPGLYDSTIRILQGLRRDGLAFDMTVIPGITSVQALAAAHQMPLTGIGEALTVTTGRQLAAGFPDAVGSVAVMLDGEQTYGRFADAGLDIVWGAYVGMPEEILVAGKLAEVAPEIDRRRAAARLRHGWIMDTYILRRGDAPM